MDEIGREIRRLREEKGWNQAKLAVDAGIGVSAVSLIETGKRNPSATTLAKIAEALGVGVADLFPLGQASLFTSSSEQEEPDERPSGLTPWAAYARRVASRIQAHTEDPTSPAFRDLSSAEFFAEQANREAAELFFFIEEQCEEGPLAEEPVDVEAMNELLSALEELGQAIGTASAHAHSMEAERTDTELGRRARKRAEDAATRREIAAAQLSGRLGNRSA